ncbi:MAG: hypothetical protein HN831_04055 [Waddliaceae bacterium]|nr:hypothetical protein [Waddliaceae bacterium]
MIKIPGAIPITIQPIFWVTALAIGWMNASPVIGMATATAIWVMVILFSVLAHELGHALTARAFGHKTEIQLVMFGGVTLRDGPKLKFWQDFLVTLNGPLVGIVIFLLAGYIRIAMRGANPIAIYTIDAFLYGNAFWSILNLIPIIPLDGGGLMSILLEVMWGVKGVVAALRISFIIAAIAGATFFAFGWMTGLIFFLFAAENYRALKQYSTMTENDSDKGLRGTFDEALKKRRDGNVEEAASLFEGVRSKAKKGVLYSMATQNIAEILYKEGKNDEAYSTLKTVQKKILTFEGLMLLQRLAYHSGDYKEAIEAGTESFVMNANTEVALYNALAHARENKAEAAVGWLKNCQQHDKEKLLRILQKTDFDNIREHKKFKVFVKMLG